MNPCPEDHSCSLHLLFPSFLLIFLGSNQIYGVFVPRALLDKCSSAPPQRTTPSSQENIKSQRSAAVGGQRGMQAWSSKSHHCSSSTFHNLLPNHTKHPGIFPLLLGVRTCAALQLFSMDIKKNCIFTTFLLPHKSTD